MRLEFDTRHVFRSLKVAPQALDEWVVYYNSERPHQSLADATPATRFHQQGDGARAPRPVPERSGEQWVTRRVGANGVVCVEWQQVSVGKNYAGSACNVLVSGGLFQFWIGNELLKTVARTGSGPIRKKNASGTSPRPR